MKRLYAAFALITISLLSFHCQRELSNINNGGGTAGNDPAPLTAILQGNITDENGQPAMDVAIKVGNKTATTNAHGYFRIVNASLDKNASLVTAEKTGYFKAYRTFNATSGVNQVVIKLVRKTLAGTVVAGSGGDVTLSNGSKISLPANGVVKASGGSYSGTVNVYASYIDPTAQDIFKTVPGSFMADDKNNKRVFLTSYGMLAVELTSSAGEKLQIAAGSTATLTMPIPSSVQSTAPATISLWYVDEQTGIWKEEGTATKNGNNYVGEVKHFSFWNCDFSGPAVNLSMTFQNSEGGPMVHVHVIVRRLTAGAGHGWTDSLGQVSGLVPANENLILEVVDECNTVIYSQNIGPFSQNTNLGIITLPGTGASVVILKGKLLNCSSSPVTNGYAIIYYDNMVRYASVNSNGDFSTTFTSCSGSPATCQVLGVDVAAQQQGSTINVTVVSPITNTGNISACGTSTLEYINYNLDGVSYNISNQAQDSLIYYSFASQTTPPQYTWITGVHSTTAQVTFDFYGNAAAGSYPVDHLSIQNYNHTALIQPFDVTVTNFPSAVGQFSEGSFSGQFRDSSNLVPVHAISCSYRLRKNF